MPNFENNTTAGNENENHDLLQKNIDEQDKVRSRKEERHKLENEHDIVFEERKLAAFAKAMDGEEYYIAGGLAQEIDKGQIECRHEDIDIIVFRDQEEKIINTLRDQGFDVFKKPQSTAHDLEAANFEMDEASGQILKAPAQGPLLYIGIYVYDRNEEKGTASRFGLGGAVNAEFPLSYFDREKLTMDYKGNKLTVADLRSVVTSKMISERPKDIEDVKNMMPILKARYSSGEMEELKNINKENIKNRTILNLKHWMEEFSKSDRHIDAENIIEYFSFQIEESMQKIKNEDYAKAAREFLENIKGFTASSEDPEVIKKDFWGFMLHVFEPVADYHDKIIDKAFE